MEEFEYSKSDDTFLDYVESDLTDYLQAKINIKSKAHQKYNEEYNKISELYPNVTRALEYVEDLEDFELTKQELKALLKLRKLEFFVRAYENEICFKLGIKEVLNLKK